MAVIEKRLRPTPRTMVLTAVAMLAFAGNSLLCRLALADARIDPATFTLVRLISGSLMLLLIVAVAGYRPGRLRGSWLSALALVAYAATFSYAYVRLEAGTGAFLLFASVQATMVITGCIRGNMLSMAQWVGLALALAGLALLVSPGASAPPFASAVLMLLAGIAWGAYSLLGRGETDAIGATTGNFLRSVPIAVVLLLPAFVPAFAPIFATGTEIQLSGLVYAVLSGAIASGAGYAIWYAALPGLSPAQGASVQLSVPVITALGGAIALAEPLTIRLGLSSVTILGGILLVIFGQRRT